MTTDIQLTSDYQVITVWDNKKYADDIIDAYKKIVPTHILNNISEIKRKKGIRPILDEMGCAHIWKYVLLGVALINEKGKIDLYGDIQINGNQIISAKESCIEDLLWTNMPTPPCRVKPFVEKTKEMLWWILILVAIYYVLYEFINLTF